MRRRGPLWETTGRCPLCPPGHPRRSHARAYAHPNPVRSSVVVWRCRIHARVQFVPLDVKQGLGGGVYR